MLSVSGKNWKETSVNKRIIEKVKIDVNLSEIQSKILISRNFTQSEINSLRNEINIFNPFLKNSDFKEGHLIIEESIKNNDRILIIGDYDVDGCVSTSLLINFFKFLKKKVDYYIPNRFIDGYGANLELVKNLLKKKTNLVIMVDCGSNSTDVVDYLNSQNIKSIIIDHHEIFNPYPYANCLINPKKKCNYNEFDYFCSSTLTYFFVNSYFKKIDLQKKFEKYLPYVLLASLCDVMPLRKINRTIALNVLNNFHKFDVDLFNNILKLKKIKRKLEINDLGFIIGPILNSAGRLDDANKIVKLITTNDNDIKNSLINKIININEKRKKVEDKMINDLDFNKLRKTNDNVLVVHDKIFNEGIIGIIASRIKEYLDKPSIVLSKSKNFYKASARSTPNFNIGKFIKLALDKKIIINGGGHNLAAGFSIKKNKINEFKIFINKMFDKNKSDNFKEYISRISLNSLNTEFYNKLKIFAPFGPDNENPIFLIENIKIIKPKIIKNKFITFYVKSKSGKLFPSISFNFLESDISRELLFNKNELNLIVQIKENIWNNKKNLQLMVLDTLTDLNKA